MVVVLAVAGAVAGIVSAPAAASAQTVRLTYGASLMNVVPLGEARIDATWTTRDYALRSSLKTSGFARLFDDTEIRASASGVVAGVGLGWSRYALEHAYAGKFRRIAMTRTARAVTSQIAPRYSSMGAPPATMAEQLASHDPLTAFVTMGRAVGVQNACAGDFRVFDGREHYRLVLSPKARGRYAGGGYTGGALVCALRYAPVSGFKAQTAAERARIPVAEIWFASPATQGFAAPLRIAAPTPGGELRVDVASFSITP
jgi:hypothetical protein